MEISHPKVIFGMQSVENLIQLRCFEQQLCETRKSISHHEYGAYSRNHRRKVLCQMMKLVPNRAFSLRFLLTLGSIIMLSVQSQAAANSYTFSSSTGVVLEDMNGFSPLFLTGQDNTASAVTNIGFSFTFNNVTYTQFSVNSNGCFRLGSTVISTTATNQLSANSDFPKLAPYWDDLATGTSGYAGYKLIGTAPNRKLCVEWILTIPKNNANSGKFQIWLFETTNQIKFVYGTGIIANTGNYSVGMAAGTTDFISVTTSTNTSSTVTENNSNTSAITSGLCYTFTPPVVAPGCATALSPVSGTTGLSPLTTLSWAAGTGNPTSYDVYFGTSPNPPLVSTAQAGTTYNPGTLQRNTTYYYQIIPKNTAGSASGCSVSQFTTAPLLNYEVAWTTGVTYTSIATTGTVVTGWRNTQNTDDNLSTAQPIGFNFNYQGTTYNSFLVSTNGFITFNTSTAANGSGGGVYGYTNSLALENGTLMIAPFNEDMVCIGNPGTQSGLDAGIRYAVSGTSGSRVLTVEWVNMEIYNNSGPDLNFQVKLYEATGAIEFVYGKMEGFNGTFSYVYSYSCGINSAYVSPSPANGEFFNQVAGNTRNFSSVPTSQLNYIPECYTKLTLTPGNYTPYILSVSIPANDNKASAQHLAVNAVPCTDYCGTYYSTMNATPSALAAACGTGNPDDDVWFEFTANNASTTIKVLSSGNFDAVAELYNSANAVVACKDTSGQGMAEIINATTLVPGQQYFLRVYHNATGSGTGSGQFSVCVSATPVPPVNDECASAITLPVTLSTNLTTGTQTGAATASAGIPVCSVSGTVPDDDVWYKFVALNTTEVVTVNSGVSFNAAIQLFSGSCGALTSIACVNATGTGQVETLTATNLTKTQTYYIRVYHAGIGGGSGVFTINVSSPLPSCVTNMSPANATPNIGASGTTLKWSPSGNTNSYKVYMDVVNPPAALLATTTDTSVVTGPLNQGLTYYWQVQPTNSIGSTTGCNVNAFATVPLDYGMRVKVFLEGYYDKSTGKMNPLLNPNDTIADSITVSLADPTTKQIQYSSKGLLSINGIGSVLFPQPALGQNWYVVVGHRNSLTTWSQATFGYNNPDTIYDFSNAVGKAFGNNQVQVNTGVYAIHSGDINQDGVINNLDYNLVDGMLGSISMGYLKEDLTGDGIIESTDYSLVENKSRAGLSILHP